MNAEYIALFISFLALGISFYNLMLYRYLNKVSLDIKGYASVDRLLMTEYKENSFRIEIFNKSRFEIGIKSIGFVSTDNSVNDVSGNFNFSSSGFIKYPFRLKPLSSINLRPQSAGCYKGMQIKAILVVTDDGETIKKQLSSVHIFN